MALTLTDLQRLLTEPEGERLEFKEAKNNYHFDKLAGIALPLPMKAAAM